MKLRITVLAVVVAAAAAATGTASAAPAAFRSCGNVKAAGATWALITTGGISCGTAKPLLKKLAGKPHPGIATRLGNYIGLKCVEFSRGKTREIACSSVDGRRTVIGVTPPHK